MSRQRLLYASDLHGSNLCFTKLVGTAIELRPSAILIGGDLTGKELEVIRDLGNGKYSHRSHKGKERTLDANQLAEQRKDWGNKGIYCAVLQAWEQTELSDEKRLDLKRSLIKKRLQQWLAFAADKLEPEKVRLVVIPGNDDPKDINKDIDESPWVENVDERRSQLGIHTIIGLGYSTPTPWKCPRELPDEEIGRRLTSICVGLNPEDLRRIIVLCHVPPHGIGLDLAPEVVLRDGELAIVPGIQKEVGSKTLSTFIVDHKPLLVLSGHCHDSPGFQYLGRTLCVNVGSSYSVGVLRMAVVVLDKDRIEGYQQLVR